MKMMKMLLLPLVAGALAMGCTGKSSDDDAGSSGGGCADNGTKEKAVSFTMDTDTDGKVCYSTTISYYFWKTTGTFAPADKFTVTSSYVSGEAGNSVTLGLDDTTATWSSSDYASDSLSSTTTTSTKADIQPVDETAAVTELYIIASPSLYADKSVDFKFKVHKQ